MDLALNKLQRLICRNIQTNKQEENQWGQISKLQTDYYQQIKTPKQPNYQILSLVTPTNS